MSLSIATLRKLAALAGDGVFDVQIAGVEKRQRRAKSARHPAQFAGDQHKGAGNRGPNPCQPVQHGAKLTCDRKQAFNGRPAARSSAQRMSACLTMPIGQPVDRVRRYGRNWALAFTILVWQATDPNWRLQLPRVLWHGRARERARWRARLIRHRARANRGAAVATSQCLSLAFFEWIRRASALAFLDATGMRDPRHCGREIART
jgi:hypothetical protein